MQTVRIIRAFAASALLAFSLGTQASLLARPAGGPAPGLSEFTARLLQHELSEEFATPELRLAAQQRAWQVVADRHYDPALNGIDWQAVRDKYQQPVIAAKSDAEMYLALKAMMRELKDSHTRVVTARESADYRRFAVLASGIALSVIDEQLLVIDVDVASPAARAGVRKGDVVVAVDEHRFDAAFFRAAPVLPASAADITSSEAEPARQDEAIRFAQLRAVRRALQRMPDAQPRPQQMTLQRGAIGQAPEQLTLTLMAEPLVRPPVVTASISDGGVAVVKLNRFSVRNRNEVAQALQQVAHARALVLDLRGNGGGDYSQFIWLVGQFLPEPRVVLTQLSRRGQEQNARELRITPADAPFLKPIAVLTDRRSGSASELTATALLEQRDALIVGESTCGCVVAVRSEYILPGAGGVRVSETGFRSAHGRRMEGEPLAPTIYAPPT
ncbi:MAG: PDZ domain-containing protein, partial [Burkholderiaceae bacterium]|nr:PDZ domain-containing protein [Burkholderiaceae bacterium]